MSELQFSDSIEDNLNTLREVIAGMPHGAQVRARKMGEKLVDVITAAMKENPKDPAIGTGVCWAVHFMAQHMTKDNKRLIQLL